ncbi:MAG: amidohydrolase family protein, partial [Pseudomonadota bacterium]|nr:amidohydrolase family protein [Pseudomonadota bacterium]
MSLIIDCHGHYTVLPKAHDQWREDQVAAFRAGTAPPPYPDIPDDEVRRTIEDNQLRLIRERGADLTIFSPRASAMAHHVGDQHVSETWAQHCNNLVYRVTKLFPDTFVGVCMLPQSPKADLAASVRELRRCVEQLGF